MMPMRSLDKTAFAKRYTIAESGCWLWLGALDDRGYGVSCFKSKRTGAHRHAWLLLVGPIKDGLFLCHKCDNPRCVNPEHMFLGTQLDNMRDMINKGRKPIGSRVPTAKLSEKQVKEILSLRDKLKPQKIADMYRVGRTTIRRIMDGHSWKHLQLT